VACTQLRQVIDRLVTAGHWRQGDPPILIVTDSGYDTARLAHDLADLPLPWRTVCVRREALLFVWG
jgi:DDE superfamily endonuclease